MRGSVMRAFLVGCVSVCLTMAAAGCTHSFGAPVVATLHTQEGVDVDVAWVIEDEHHVVRCVNGPEGPICQRASFH